MTYNVSSGMLNPTQLNSLTLVLIFLLVGWFVCLSASLRKFCVNFYESFGRGALWVEKLLVRFWRDPNPRVFVIVFNCANSLV